MSRLPKKSPPTVNRQVLDCASPLALSASRFGQEVQGNDAPQAFRSSLISTGLEPGESRRKKASAASAAYPRLRIPALTILLSLFFAFSSAAADLTNRFVLDLPTVLRLADAQNLDVQIARQLVVEARANQNSALEQFFPWISPGIQFRRYDGLGQAFPSGVISEGHFETYSPGARVAAQVSIGEAVYNSLAAKQTSRATGQALEAQRQESSTLAAQRYIELVRAIAVIEVHREGARISKLYQEQLHSAVGAGIAFRGDELRVQSETERIQIALRQAQERARILAAQLAQILHLDPAVELGSDDSGVNQITLIPENTALDRLVQEAWRNRPELAQGEALLAAARETKKGVIYGPLVPSVGLQYYGGGLGGSPDHLPDQFGSAQDFTATLGWRIGPGGLLDFGRIDATKARLEITTLRLAKIKDEITRQVVEAHTLVQSLSDQIPAVRQNLATATETLHLAQQRKEFGVGIVLEEIQAQQELVRARSDYLTAIAEFNKAQFALRRAIGGTLLEQQKTKP
jgi:outer membrane protein TolC